MSALAWIAVGVVAAVIVAAAVVLFGRRRPRPPMTPEEHLRAAREAARSIRREIRRPDHDHFNKGDTLPDRHAGAIAENAVYGDLSGGSGGPP